MPVFSSLASFSVSENQLVIGTITANYLDDDSIVFALVDGLDKAFLNLDSATGLLTFKNLPNYNTKSSYAVKISASDGKSTVYQTVTISLIEVDNSAPVITGLATVAVLEGIVNIATYNAAETVTWGVSGTDQAAVQISSLGVLSFKVARIMRRKPVIV